MKIFRLSFFNLKKNRREAAAIIFLTFITVMLLGVVTANIAKVRNVFDECFEATGSVKNLMVFRDGKYRDDYKDILEEDYGISDIRKIDALLGINTSVRDQEGKKLSYNMILLTEESERKIENFNRLDCLSEEELNAVPHPVWLPQYMQINGGYNPGDAFTLVYGGRDYPFTVAGFYDTGVCNSSDIAIKLIITGNDLTLLSGLFEETDVLVFDFDDRFPVNDFTVKCEEKSSENILQSLFLFDYYTEKFAETTYINMFMILAACLSVLTMVSAIFLIRHKIASDIEDQMQQIGVLEALGYRSGEISLSYVFEYLITVGIGAVLGTIGAVLFTPVMNNVIRGMLSRDVRGSINVFWVFASAVIISALIILFALLKAGQVKKYPPVVAFRKGIRTHHFGRNILPLEKTGKSVNIRLALKSLIRDLGKNAGTCICIFLASLALLFCIYTYFIFRNGYDALMKVTGMEVSDVTITLMNGVDAEEVRQEIEQLPEVEQALVSYGWKYVHIKDEDLQSNVTVFDDFGKTRNLFAVDGRFPEHDNEIAISLKKSIKDDLHVGDSIIVEGDSIEKSYIITGIVGAMSNSGVNVYMTDEGYLRINPNVRPNSVYVYFNEGVDRDAFTDKITSVYGTSASNALEADYDAATLEDRIRQKADEKIALLLSNYGVNSVDYAVKVGDRMITGNSRRFVIKDISSLFELAESQMRAIADTTKKFTFAGAIGVAVVVAVILGIIASSSVRRQRKDLGIMKSMGYSSKDLIKQIAIQSLPTTIIAVAIASALSFPMQKYFWLLLFSADMSVNIPLMIVTDLVIVGFCYVVTYISAGKVKKISVTELMTE